MGIYEIKITNQNGSITASKTSQGLTQKHNTRENNRFDPESIVFNDVEYCLEEAYHQHLSKSRLGELSRQECRELLSNLQERISKTGSILFDSLGPDLANKLRTREKDQDDFKGLGININLEEDQIHDLPWEYLHDHTVFIENFDRTTIFRKLEGENPSEIISDLVLRVLIIASCPKSEARLSHDLELGKILEIFQPLRGSGKLAFHIAKPTVQGLKEALKTFQPHILFYTGHAMGGKNPCLYFEREENATPTLLGPFNFGRYIKRCDHLKVLFFNACDSLEFTRRTFLKNKYLLNRIQAVYCTNYKIDDATSVAFSTNLFKSLLNGKSYLESLRLARKSILELEQSDGIPHIDWGVPIAYLKHPGNRLINILPEKDGSNRASTEKQKIFFGRKKEIDEILSSYRLEQQIYFLSGDKESGKTVFLSELLAKLNKREDCYVLPCLSMGSHQANSLVDQIIFSLSPEISTNDHTPDEIQKLDYARNLISKQADLNFLVLAVDEFENLLSRDSSNSYILSDRLSQSDHEFLTWIISSIEDRKFQFSPVLIFSSRRIWQKTKVCDIFRNIRLEAFSRLETVNFLTTLPFFGSLPKQILVSVYERFGGHPGLLVRLDQLFADAVRSKIEAAEDVEQVTSDIITSNDDLLFEILTGMQDILDHEIQTLVTETEEKGKSFLYLLSLVEGGLDEGFFNQLSQEAEVEPHARQGAKRFSQLYLSSKLQQSLSDMGYITNSKGEFHGD